MHVALRPESVDGFPVEAAANRMAAAETDVRFLPAASGTVPAGAIVASEAAARAAGLRVVPLDPEAEAVAGRPLALPRIAILAGRASAYPYYAYYAHALACLGYRFSVVDGADIAAGRLDEHDLFVIPGGFAIWGLDRCERVVGADAAVRRFLAEGGSAIGSCGGAFYLSAGRPGWLGLAAASPRYTHEYLSTGAGVVSVIMTGDEIGAGTAPLVEMPYYHGPVYEAVEPPTTVSARFQALSFPAHIPIDNPIEPERFEREMAGRAAILTTASPAGRAVLFSTHPEMGDLVRKYVAVASYVERYLPIRGEAVMRETMDFYQPNAAPAFRLIFNAIQWCAAAPGARVTDGAQRLEDAGNDTATPLIEIVADRLRKMDCGASEIGVLLERERRRLLEVADALASRDVPVDPGMERAMTDAAAHLSATDDAAIPTVQRLLDAELALSLIEATLRRADLSALL